MADVATAFPEVLRIHLDQRWVLLDTDEILPIDSMYDTNGDTTESQDEAVAVVAGTDQRGWFTISLGDILTPSFS